MMAETSGQVFHSTTKVQEFVPQEKLQQISIHPKRGLPHVRHSPESQV